MIWPSFHSTCYKKRIATIMVVAGVINSISNEWASRIIFNTRNTKYNEKMEIIYALSQMVIQFFGKILCIIIFKFLTTCTKSGSFHPLALGKQKLNLFLLLPAVLCEIVAALIAYVGLSLLYKSYLQIPGSSTVFFVVMISVSLLRREITPKKWPGIFIVIISMAAVGAIGILYDYNCKNNENIISGNVLVIIAQILVAWQMVYEEKYLIDLDISPLQAVGWEGMLGLAITTSILTFFYWASHSAADMLHGIIEIGFNPLILIAMLISTISFSFYAFSAASITKETSAVTRVLLETIRTPIVWMVYSCIKWQDFHWMYLLSFTGLLLGICTYVNVHNNEQSCNESEVGNEQYETLTETCSV